MALFYVENSAKKSTKSTALSRFSIQSLDYQGLGVAKHQGKLWFVENALPDEVVEARIIEEKRQYGRAKAVNFLQKSAIRQSPSCAIFSQCGGCQMQHIPVTLQRETKQKILFDRLQRLQVEPIEVQAMIVGQDKHYRRRAKLSIAIQHNQLIIGFRQHHSQQIVPVRQCEVLEPTLSALLPKLQRLFAQWEMPKKLGHLELVRADNGIALLLRHIGSLHLQDRKRLMAFAESENLMLFVMSEKEQIEQWRGEMPYYQIEGVKLVFSIRDFIQINSVLNQQMVKTAMDWLALNAQDRVLDLFCGIGNFTLPMALRAKFVVGIEGVGEMVAQAEKNAQVNQLTNVAFYQTDLAQSFADKDWAKDHFNKVLLDPARDGALFALEHLCQLQPERIVYVSCNPATLVRDTEKLISQGYQLVKCAMIDMFPQTAHLESISLFVKK